MLFLSDLGFAMLMFTVGAHVPLRDPRLYASLRSGEVAAGVVLLLAPPGGWAAARSRGPATPRSMLSSSAPARSPRSYQ